MLALCARAMNEAVAFAQRVIDSGALYFRANPANREWPKALAKQNRNFLAHEYFTEDWRLVTSSDMARILRHLRRSNHRTTFIIQIGSYWDDTVEHFAHVHRSFATSRSVAFYNQTIVSISGRAMRRTLPVSDRIAGRPCSARKCAGPFVCWSSPTSI